jgi:hypothetical protein
VYETIDLVSDSGLFFIKHWLDSHNGQDSIGGLAVFGVKDMGGCIYETIEEGPHIGRSIIRKCIETDTTDSHALTIVGFNDSIRYDLNLDGSIDTNEYGAIKVANSWGLSIWPPNPDPDYKDGYCCIPYSLMQNDTFLLDENAYICHAINNQPEIVLYSKMTHPNRDTFALQLGFDTIAINQYFNQRPSVWTLTNHHAGSFPLTGFESPNDTLEICLDFTYQYNLYDCNNLGRIYYRPKTWGNYVDSGMLWNATMVDYRWGETFELAFEDLPDTMEYTEEWKFSVDYDLLPFSISNDTTLYTDQIFRLDDTIKEGATLTIGGAHTMTELHLHNADVLIEAGGELILSSYSPIIAKSGDNTILVKGNLIVKNDALIKAENDATLSIIFDNDTLEWNATDCEFDNIQIKGSCAEMDIDNCSFTD